MSEEERKVEGQEGAPETDLGKEFAELGRRLSLAAQSAWETQEARDFRKEVREGMEKLLRELERGIETAQAHPTTKKVQEEVEEALETVRSGRFAQEVEVGLTRALRELNEELGGIIQRLSEARPAEKTEEED